VRGIHSFAVNFGANWTFQIRKEMSIELLHDLKQVFLIQNFQADASDKGLFQLDVK
jgi:hypothetical protein